MKLKDYQNQDAVRLASASKPMLLASDTGTGKTAVVVNAAMIAGHKSVVVVCPAVARGVWEQEWKRWAPSKWGVIRIDGSEDICLLDMFRSTPYTVVIVSYDAFSQVEGKGKNKLSPIRRALTFAGDVYDLLVCDEAHFLKGNTSNRTTEVYAFAKCCTDVWTVSATPAPNNYAEIYPMISALWPDKLHGMTYEAFVNEFCTTRSMWINGREIPTISGSKNGAKLKAMLSDVMIRRLKKDVLKELPPMIFDTLPLDAGVSISSPDQAELDGMTDDELLAYVEKNRTHVATERRQLGLAKVSVCVEWIEQQLEPNPHMKIIVFAYHTEVIQRLKEKLLVYNPVVIEGRTTPGERDKAVVEFEKGKSRVFIGQIIAAGTAITLNAANDVLFVESDWTPSNNYQAASRCHRIGQTNNVIVRHAVVEKSLDERIGRILARKEQELAEVFE